MPLSDQYYVYHMLDNISSVISSSRRNVESWNRVPVWKRKTYFMFSVYLFVVFKPSILVYFSALRRVSHSASVTAFEQWVFLSIWNEVPGSAFLPQTMPVFKGVCSQSSTSIPSKPKCILCQQKNLHQYSLCIFSRPAKWFFDCWYLYLHLNFCWHSYADPRWREWGSHS